MLAACEHEAPAIASNRPMTGSREAELLEATDLLLDARRTGTTIADLPPALQPTSMEEAFWVQSQLILSFGDVGGWKVGAPSPDATPLCAPMPAAWIAGNASSLVVSQFRFRGLEAEVAFLLGSDLPARSEPYTEEEIADAIKSCHPAIEILESGLTDPTSPSINRLSQIADLQMHGGFVYGSAYADWRSIDFSKERVSLAVDSVVRVERIGSNTSGNLMRLLPWLANEASTRTGGLRAGQWITTGSWTGVERGASGQVVDVTFGHLGRVSCSFT